MLNIIWCRKSSVSLIGDMRQGKYSTLTLKTEVTYIQFTDILEVLVQRFNHIVDKFKHAQLVDIIIDIYSDNKVQWSVPSIDNFVLTMI